MSKQKQKNNLTRSEPGIFMNNLLSYCGLVDAKTRASDKDLPVQRLFRHDQTIGGLFI